MEFTKLPENMWTKIQLNAGVIATSFTPETGTLSQADIIGATTGGVQFSATPSYVDFGEDVDNCPKNTKELKKIDGWDIKMSGTFVSIDVASAKKLLGSDYATAVTYDLTEDTSIQAGKTYYTRSGTSPNYTYTPVTSPSASSLSTYYEVSSTEIMPSNTCHTFSDIWWIGDYDDGSGDYIAIKMMNSLSTGGFQIKSTDKGKGNFAFEFTAHFSLNNIDQVPFEVYMKGGD